MRHPALGVGRALCSSCRYPAAMDAPLELGTTAWYVVMLMAGLAVGVAIAIARAIFRNDD